MKNKSLLIVLFLLQTFYSFPLSLNIRSYDHQNYTRIVFEGDSSFTYNFYQSPDKKDILIDLNQQAQLPESEIRLNNSKIINRVINQVNQNKTRLLLVCNSRVKINRHFVLEEPFRLVFDLVESQPQAFEEPQAVELEEEDPAKILPQSSKNGKSRLIETICIDPGHGGSDLGAIGKTGLLEKAVTLQIAKKLKAQIEAKLGIRVIMTRKSDVEVSLNNRVAIGNNQKAQIFISIHVNSSFRKIARGSETFYVSLKATDKESFELANKENSSFRDLDQLADSDELKMILWNMAQTEYIKESSKLASYIQNELNILLNTRNRGVKQAPFRVLMRAAMPAVLVEVAFISNDREEKQLLNDGFLNRIAAAIYGGVSRYISFHNNRVQ